MIKNSKQFHLWMKKKKMTKQDFLEAYTESKRVDGSLTEELHLRMEGIKKYKEVIGVFSDIWNTGQGVFGDGSYIFDIFEQYVNERSQLQQLEEELKKQGIIPISSKNYRDASTHVKKILIDVENMKMSRSKYMLSYEIAKEKRQGKKNDETKTIEITFEDD